MSEMNNMTPQYIGLTTEPPTGIKTPKKKKLLKIKQTT